MKPLNENSLKSYLPYSYKSVTKIKSTHYNQLFCKNRSLSFELNDNGYDVSFFAHDYNLKSHMTAEIQIDEGIFFRCFLGKQFLKSILSEIPHMEDFESMPEMVRNIALEVALETVLDEIDQSCGCQSRITQSSTINESNQTNHQRIDDFRKEDENYRVPFHLKQRDDPFIMDGLLQTNAVGMTWLIDQLNGLPEKKVEKGAGIPLTGQLEIGHIPLSLNELRTLELGDVIVTENTSPVTNPDITIRLSAGYALEGIITSPTDILIQDLNIKEGDTTSPMEKTMTSIENANHGLDGIPVRLVFELGEIPISVGQLKNIQPGYTFHLDQAIQLEKPVTIRANGMNIGLGEILQIDNQIGVRIVDLNGINPETESNDTDPDESESPSISIESSPQPSSI